MSYKEIRQTESKRDSTCEGCGKPLKQGSQCIVNPKGKKVYHVTCAKKAGL
jgi:RNase P subunit RPR2